MSESAVQSRCRVVVIWIDWYPYHVARLCGLLATPALAGSVVGLELVGGIGVHAGLKFREDLPADLPIQTLMPGTGWKDANQFKLARLLWRRLSELDPEIVLVPGYYTLPGIAAALWARIHGAVSVLMTESTAYDHSRTWWKEGIKSLTLRALFNWAISGGKAHVKYLHQLRFPRQRILTAYDVVDNDFFRGGTDALLAQSSPAKHGLPASPYFLYVGRLAPEKNVVTLLGSWLKYRQHGGSWPLVLVGDGAEAGILRSIAAASSFAAQVHFPGLKSSRELLPFYAFAGCFVLPSTREPWGLVVNEAMASGLPVLVSNRCGCAPDLVSIGGNGFLLDPTDGSAITELLSKIAQLSPAVRAHMGNVSTHIVSEFSPAHFGQSIASIAHSVDRNNLQQSLIAPQRRSSPQGMFSECKFPHFRSVQRREFLSASAPPASWMQVVSHIDPRYGGLSAFVPALTRRLTQPESPAESEAGTYLTGSDVSLAAFCNSDERFKPEGVSARQLSFWSPSHSAWLRDTSLRRSFETQVRAADGLHIHGLWEISTTVAARTARRLAVPYILSAHGMLEPWALRAKRLKKLVYAALLERSNVSGASCLHALTRAEAGHYLRFGARSPIAIIPNAVEVPAYSDSEPFLDAFPALRGRSIVLFLGRIHPKKGLDLLLEAWTELSSTHPDAHLVLAGPDCEGTQSKLEETIAVRRLESSVTFTGMLGGTMKWSALAAAEAFVLPSHSEGLSVGVLEAMGMGLPVLVTQPCNMPEVLEHRAGWQVPVEIRSITAALQQLLANSPEANRQIGLRGADLIASRYCWPVVTRQFAALYAWVLDGTPMASAPSSIQLVVPENLL